MKCFKLKDKSFYALLKRDIKTNTTEEREIGSDDVEGFNQSFPESTTRSTGALCFKAFEQFIYHF